MKTPKAIQQEIDNAPLRPEFRALEGITGTPLDLGDAGTWLLSDGGLLNALDEVRDRIDDEARLNGEVNTIDMVNVAIMLLIANYDLTHQEAASLVLEADGTVRATAVMLALFGPPTLRRTYTTWAASALIANGIDPSSVPGPLRPHVLAQLEATGRCVPRDQYIESAEAAPKIHAIRARVKAEADAKAARIAAREKDSGLRTEDSGPKHGYGSSIAGPASEQPSASPLASPQSSVLSPLPDVLSPESSGEGRP